MKTAKILPVYWALGMIIILIAAALFWTGKDRRPVLLKGVSGPAKPTLIAPPQPTSWQAFESGGLSSMAVLLTDVNSGWLGVAHGLKNIGIPFVMTTNTTEALKHRVVLVYPLVAGSRLSPESLRSLAAHPREGGTLIAVNVLGGGLNELFGFSEAVASTNEFTITFDSTNVLTAEFREPEEREIRVSDPGRSQAVAGTHYYANSKQALAVYNNQQAAITERILEHGKAYAIGFDLGYLLLRGHNGRAEGIGRSYVNAFEPSNDAILRLLKNIYLANEPNAVTLGTVPHGKAVTVMLTHDVDYNRSLSNALAYAAVEKEAGVTGTFFIQTKYMRDFYDEAFYNESSLEYVRQLEALGMEVASHSVSHSKQFDAFAVGTGTETYPDYAPFVRNHGLTVGGSILGELRISKFLLEHATGTPVVSWRPGHLRNPFELPEALTAAGYLNSSTLTAGNALSHLPFRLNRSRRDIEESVVFEFPVTIEDELPPLLGDRVAASVALTKKIGNYGGIVVVLVHPNITDHKLKFVKEYIAAVRDDAWFATMRDFGDWWRRRDQVTINVTERSDRREITVRSQGKIEGLTLQLPKGIHAQDLPENLGVKALKDGVIELPPFSGEFSFSFRK